MATPTIFQRIARIYMILQALNNIIFGAYCVSSPSAFATFAGGDFASSPESVLRGVGLGMLGVGVYGVLGAVANWREFYLVTVGLRVGFGFVMGALGESWGVVGYEVLTAGMAWVACGGAGGG